MGERMVTLLREARQLHEAQPRLGLNLEVGRICAMQAKTMQEQAGCIEEIGAGKAWLESQWKSWQSVAKDQEKLIQEQRAWIAQLEQGKAWLESQWKSWQSVAENQWKVIQEQRAWIAPLERGKAWVPQSLRRAVKNLVMRKLADD
jgi:hypothetical protein